MLSWRLGLIFGLATGAAGCGYAQAPAADGVPGGSMKTSTTAQSGHAGTPGAPRIAGGVMAGMILTKVTPVYPAEAKAKGIAGTVVMRAVIGKDGTIESLQMVSGPEELRQSAWDAVKQWTYKPYLLNGEPTSVDTTITVNYTFGRQAAATTGDDSELYDRPPVEEADAGAALVGPLAPGTARVSGGVMAGMIVKKVTPVYPAEAKAHYITGSVVMRAIISKDGSISRLTVVSGPEELRKSAVNAVSKWRYRPYILMGVPTEVDTTITVNYNMGG